jgi:endogenous inhibitor of DNA gyrase (YacG/DUF329 family)
MAKVILRQAAIDDLNNIWDYTVKNGQKIQALEQKKNWTNFVTVILQTTQKLKTIAEKKIYRQTKKNNSCPIAVKKQNKHRKFASNNLYICRIIDLEQWQNTSMNTKTGRILLGMIKP